MQEAPFFADCFSDRRNERDHIMLRLRFNFLHASDVDFGVLAQPGDGVTRYFTTLGQRFAGQEFNL